jgi:hypothetical protein
MDEIYQLVRKIETYASDKDECLSQIKAITQCMKNDYAGLIRE